MLEIHKSYVVDENQKAIAVQIPIEEFEQIEKILKQVDLAKMRAGESGWLDTDLSRLGEYEPYEWEPGELGSGKPVKYIDGIGLVVIDE